MKTLNVLLATLFLVQSALALDVNVRDQKMNLVRRSFDENEVLSGHVLENDHFRVVLSESEEPVDLLDPAISREDKLRASTTLYHLNIARDYFVKTLGAQYVQSLPKITVRIGMAKPFNEFYHFLKDSKINEANNALTIPASGTKKMPEASPWNMEIWFRPAEKKEIDNVVFQIGKAIDQSGLSSVVTGVIVDKSVSDTAVHLSLTQSLSSVDYIGQLSSLLVTVGVLQVVPKFLMLVSKPFKSEAFLDTAMIPEVSYHEFSHVALSDEISVRQSTPLNEGIANYFAAVINHSAKIAARNGDHSKNVSPYNGDSKMSYSSLLETNKSSHTSFVFSFLWKLRKRMSKEFTGGEILTDKLIYEARNHVTYADRPIKDDLLPSLFNSVDAVFGLADARKARMIITNEATKAGI